MQLPIFKLEDYLSAREFSARYLLCSSDMQTHGMGEIIAMADQECMKLWDDLCLGYIETQGKPLLLEAIAELCEDPIQRDNILVFAGAQEGIFCALQSFLTQQDHAIVVAPCYQSLESIPSSICDVTTIALNSAHNWQLDLQVVEASIRPHTKLFVINFPNNPTGAVLSKDEQAALIALARKHGIWIFSDEAFRFLESDEDDRRPTIASEYERGLSLGGMSKAFGLAGVRVGWIACQDKAVLKNLNNFKHYLSICNSGPSELLSLIALRNKKCILSRNLSILKNNLGLLDAFFKDYSPWFDWVRPKGGCVGFPRLKAPVAAHDFATTLLDETGIVILPNTVYDLDDNHFRIGFGRKNMPEVLSLFKDCIDRHKPSWKIVA